MIDTQNRGYKFTDLNGNTRLFVKLSEADKELFGGAKYQNIYQRLFGGKGADQIFFEGYKIEVVDLNKIFSNAQ
jgi:hypothetical protein